MASLEAQVAIITGAAQGFGKEFAIRLLSHGSKVCISDINQDQGQKCLKELQETYGVNKVTFLKCDVSRAENWTALWEHTEKAFEAPVTLLVNNAGLISNWKTSLDVMLYGTCHGTYLALEKMSTAKGGGGGLIVNIASMAGFLEGMRNIEEAGYTMAKSAVVALTRSFGQRGRNGPVRRDGVKAFALCPWFANTQLVRDQNDIEELEAKMKYRVLTVSEVGDAFEEALKLKVSGACYTIFPDCPIFDHKNPNWICLFAMIAFGRGFFQPLGLKSFSFSHFLLVISFFLLAAIFLINFLLG